MKNNTDVEVERFGMDKYKAFVKDNWVVFVGIIIILGLVIYDIGIAYEQKCGDTEEAVSKCVEHYKEQFQIKCGQTPDEFNINTSQY